MLNMILAEVSTMKVILIILAIVAIIALIVVAIKSFKKGVHFLIHHYDVDYKLFSKYDPDYVSFGSYYVYLTFLLGCISSILLFYEHELGGHNTLAISSQTSFFTFFFFTAALLEHLAECLMRLKSPGLMIGKWFFMLGSLVLAYVVGVILGVLLAIAIIIILAIAIIYLVFLALYCLRIPLFRIESNEVDYGEHEIKDEHGNRRTVKLTKDVKNGAVYDSSGASYDESGSRLRNENTGEIES